MPNDDILPVLPITGAECRLKVALCMSGAGSNAEKLLEAAASGSVAYRIVCIFTDAPESSRSIELGKKYDIPVESLDIRKFYLEHGESDIKLNTPERRALREQWTEAVWKILEPYKCDFVVFAGFVPLNNLPVKIPCLNVHPGDLTVEKDGVRIYAGLHCQPVERAILDGRNLRSSVILVQGYSGNGEKELDGGPILGISPEVKVDLEGYTLDALAEIKSARKTPPFSDALRQIALKNIESLKTEGDHVVLPQVVDYFASGRYGRNASGELFFKEDNGSWIHVETVEFFADKAPAPRKKTEVRKRSANKFIRFCKYLYTKMVRDKGTPDYIARGWAIGVFVGCVIPVFCQLIIAIPLSFLFRGSKIGAALGTFVTTPPTAVFIYPLQIFIGNKIINGDLTPLAAEKLLSVFNDSSLTFMQKWSAFGDMGIALVAAFFAGGAVWAIFMTPLTYFAVRFLVVRYRRMRSRLFKKQQ